MTSFHFVGGEDHDFTKNGTCTVDTATTAARRTANARCALKIAPSSATDSWNASFSSALSSFWLTARLYAANTFSSYEAISLVDAGGLRRVILRTDSGGSHWQLVKKNAAGTYTVLATASVTPPLGALFKVDVFVNYAASGTLQLYVDGTLVLTYSGDLTTDSVTTLGSFSLGIIGTSSNYWSEVICADTDTRGLSLVTLAPSANGNTFTFDSGSVSSINETTLDDGTLISSGTAGQLAQFTVGSSGISGNPAIKAVCVSVRAAKGGTGPQNAKMNVRTGGADYLSGSLALPSSLGRIQGVFTTNPGTSSPWAYTDLTAVGFNVGIQSVT